MFLPKKARSWLKSAVERRAMSAGEVALYLAALREPRNAKFVLLPHNAVPLVPRLCWDQVEIRRLKV